MLATHKALSLALLHTGVTGRVTTLAANQDAAVFAFATRHAQDRVAMVAAQNASVPSFLRTRGAPATVATLAN